jgi:hypothetical protein
MRLVETRLSVTAAPPSGRSSEPSLLRVAADGSSFTLGAIKPCDLRTRVPLRRLLLTLVSRRQSSPGSGVSSAVLLESGWPGEVVKHEAGLHRVHVAIATLRRFGLGDRIIKQSDGYLLDPRLDVELLP